MGSYQQGRIFLSGELHGALGTVFMNFPLSKIEFSLGKGRGGAKFFDEEAPADLMDSEEASERA